MQQDHSGFALKDVPAIVKRIDSFCTTAEQQVPVLDTLWDGWRNGLEEIQKKTSQATPCSKVAVIGSNADSVPALLGNYHGDPSAPVTFLAGLKETLGDTVELAVETGRTLRFSRPNSRPNSR